jgi:hypothetical protein
MFLQFITAHCLCFELQLLILSSFFSITGIPQIKKPSHPFQGNPAIFIRPVAFRPCLTAGLALSKVLQWTYEKE